MYSKKLTILLCLKDRSEYSKSWIENNIFNEYNYIIADGSSDNRNAEIFNNITHSNVRFLTYEYDQTIEIYLKKIIDAISKVKTPYIMRVDNDDILIQSGLEKCIKELERNSEYGVAHGNLRGIRIVNNNLDSPRYKINPGLKEDYSDLIGLTGIAAIERLLCPYRMIWYGVYRTEIYKKIWNEIQESRLKNIFLIEILQSQLALIYTKLRYVNQTYYLRLSNPLSSTTLLNQTNDYPDWHKIFFNQEYRNEVNNMGIFIARSLNEETSRIFEIYRYMYSSFGSNKDRIRNLLIKACKIIIASIIIFPIPNMSGSSIKKIFTLSNYF